MSEYQIPPDLRKQYVMHKEWKSIQIALPGFGKLGSVEGILRADACEMIERIGHLDAENRQLREALDATNKKNAEIRLLQFKGAALQAYGSHVSPDVTACQENAAKEPHGERLRNQLEEWLTANKIVSILMDTKGHLVEIHNAPPLPPNIRPVLTYWGSIYVETDEYGTYEPQARAALAQKETK